MATKNFRARYTINDSKKSIDFSVTGTINDETINLSAQSKIGKKHSGEDYEIISIKEIDIY